MTMMNTFLIAVLVLIAKASASGGPGSACTDDYDCSGKLVCESNVCKVPDRGICDPADPFCAMMRPCIGAGDVKKCKDYRLPGEICGRDPFWLCNPAQAVCTDDEKCKIPLGKSCAGFEDECKAPGACIDDVCKIPDGGKCFGMEEFCEMGTVCQGRPKKAVCKKPLMPGDRCTRFTKCQDFSECIKRKCRITERGVCNDFPDLCKPGLDCVGTGDVKKCKARRTPGQICEQDPFWVCELRSSCVAQGEGEPKRCEINEGEDCEGFEDDCIDGTMCEKVRRKTICNPILEKGDACKRSGKGGRCGPGLICKRGWCVPDPVPEPVY